MRPLPISIAAVFFILVGGLTILALFFPEFRELAKPLWPIALSSCVLLISGIGLWRLKRWSVIFFTVMWVLQYLAVAMAGYELQWSDGLVGLTVILTITAIYWRQLE